MKQFKFVLFCLAILVFQTTLNAQLLYNNGVDITVNSGIIFFIDGTVQNESGQIDVDNVSSNSEMIIEGDFINNATAGGDGYYRVSGDWVNNNTFNGGAGTVFLEGAAQFLDGTISTTFFNLTLNGTGDKTQTIDQFCDGVLSLNDIELKTETFGFYVDNPSTSAITLSTGFVSSLDGGFLSRRTNVSDVYLFPVGSSVGTARYRPIEISPTTVTANTYTVRMANVDATTEGYDRSLMATDVCEINPLFYHQILRTNGTSAIDLDIYYDNVADGDWDGISNWTTGPNLWDIIVGSSTALGAPLYKASTTAWNDFSEHPYALYSPIPVATLSSNAPVCEGENLLLQEVGGDAVSWSWDGPDSFTSTDQNPTIIAVGPAANGLYTVTITNAYGCTASDSQTIKVDGAVDATITPDGPFCETDATVNLIAASMGGTWSGDGVVGDTFDPSAVLPGDHIISYSVSNGTCSDNDTETFHVDADVDATITAVADLCEGAGSVVLTAVDAGGTWSGTGVSGNSFDPAIAGDGDHLIQYDITNGACSDSDTETIHVDADVDATITAVADLCESSSSIALTAVDAGGAWSGTGVTGSNFDPTSAGAGDHTIQYDIANGACTDFDTEVIHVDSDVDATITAVADLCESSSPVVLTAVDAGGTWSGIGVSGNSFDPNTSGSGDHTVQYDIANGACTDFDTEVIHVDSDVDATITALADLCESSSSVVLTAVDAGGTWSGTGVTGSNFDPNAAGPGDHTVQYDITNGTCSDSDTEIIHVDSDVDATITPIGPFCDSEAAVALTAVDGGGIWSGTGVIGSNFDPATAGDGIHNVQYDITNGACSDSDNINVTVNASPIVPVISVDCTGGVDAGIITITSPIGANYEYSIGGPYQAGVAFGPLTNGTYTVTVEDITSNCTTAGLPINLDCGCPNPATLTLSATTGNTCDIVDEIVAGNIFGGSATEVTLSHDGAGTLDQTTISASPFSFTYTPDATDAGNDVIITITTDNPLGLPCSPGVQTYTITVNPIPSVTAGNQTPVCVGGDLTLTETGGDAVLWTWDGPNAFGSNDNNPVISPIMTDGNGTYSITITDINGCTNTGSTPPITVNPIPAITIGSNSPICEGSDLNLTESGLDATAWAWTGPTAFGSSDNNPIITSATTSNGGSYIVVVTDANGCTATDNILVQVDSDVDATITTTGPFCESETSISLVANTAGGTWSGSGVTLDIFDPSTAGPGDHLIQYNVSNGACSDFDTETLHVDADVDATITPVADLCEDASSVTLTATDAGGTWSGTGTSGNSFDPNTAGPGDHTVQYDITNGACSDSDTELIHVDSDVDATITTTGPFCESETSISLVANTAGGTWSGSGVTLDVFNPSSVGSGDYLIQYDVTNGACSDSDTETLHVDTDVDATITPIGPFCESEPATTLTAVDNGGTWSGTGVLLDEFDPAIASDGTHNIQYNIANGACSDSDNIDIIVNANPIIPTTSIDCTGGEDAGIITVTSPTGVEYEYDIGSGNQASVDFGPLTNGNYTITVQDINSNCTSESAIINLDCGCINPPSLSLTANTGNTCSTDAITIDANTFGGSATQVDLIHNGSGTLNASSFSSTPFSFTYTPDASDEGADVTITITTNNPGGAPCVSDFETYVLTVYTLPNITIGSNSPICSGDDIQLSETGGDATDWSWTGPTSFTSDLQDPTVLGATSTQSGTYTVVVEDANMCTNTENIDVVVNDNPPTPTASVDCSGGEGNAIITVTTPLGIDYEYSIGGVFQAEVSFGSLSSGNYTITVTDVNTTCTTASELINVDCGCINPPTVSLDVANGETCGEEAITISDNTFGGNASEVSISHDGNGTLDATTVSTSPFSFTYNPNASDIGNTVTITLTTDNPFGAPCTVDVETFELTIFDFPTVSAGSNSPICEGDDINLTETGGDAIGWSWDGPNSFTSSVHEPSITSAETAAIGAYIVTITDINGCTASDNVDVLVNVSADPTITEPGNICSITIPFDLTAADSGGTWSGDGVDPATGEFDPEIAGVGVHEITYTISGTCGGSDIVYITVLQQADATILSDIDTLFIIDPAEILIATDNGGSWLGNGTDTITGEFTPSIADLGVHSIIYTIDGPCGDEDSITIVIIPEPIPDLIIPDVLTPNNDGYNDTWRIQGIRAFDIVNIVIFNRWGDEVFLFNGTGDAYFELANQFDGIRNGKELPFGTYVYLLELDNEEVFKGTLTIIR